MIGEKNLLFVIVLALLLFLISCSRGGVFPVESPPSVPDGLMPDSLEVLQDGSNVLLLWSESVDPQNYAVEYVIAFNLVDVLVHKYYTTSATSLEITKVDLFGVLSSNTEYSWKVKAVNSKGLHSEFSELARFITE